MAQPIRGMSDLKYVGQGSYVYRAKYIIRRYLGKSEWEVRDYGYNQIASGKTLQEAVRNLKNVLKVSPEGRAK